MTMQHTLPAMPFAIGQLGVGILVEGSITDEPAFKVTFDKMFAQWVAAVMNVAMLINELAEPESQVHTDHRRTASQRLPYKLGDSVVTLDVTFDIDIKDIDVLLVEYLLAMLSTCVAPLLDTFMNGVSPLEYNSMSGMPGLLYSMATSLSKSRLPDYKSLLSRLLREPGRKDSSPRRRRTGWLGGLPRR